MRGRVLPAGADFQVLTGGITCAHLDARCLIELDEGEGLFGHNTALRHPSTEDSAALMRREAVQPEAVCFRYQPRFDIGLARWDRLGERPFINCGERPPGAVRRSAWKAFCSAAPRRRRPLQVAS